jgi:hypothetical protein
MSGLLLPGAGTSRSAWESLRGTSPLPASNVAGGTP